jgi:hypothetical protein
VIYAISTLVVVCAVQSWMLWRLLRGMRDLAKVEDRLAAVTQGLSLLIDTSEAGFAMLGNELGKIAADSARTRSTRVTARRLTAAAARGRDLAGIASDHGISEGEVRLRMHLATSDTDAYAIQGDRRGSVRA